MSALKLLLAPNENTKPWLKIFVDTITAKVMNVTSAMSISSLEVKNNLLVDGYTNSHSDQVSSGIQTQSTSMVSVGLTASTGGDTLTLYNRTLKKIVLSGTPGTNTAVSTVDGGLTWSQLTTPFAFPIISYSTDLNLYTGIEAGTTTVYTSPTAVNGTWVVGTPYSGPGVLGQRLFYSPAFQRWYTTTTDPNFRVASSVTGSLYAPQASNRDFSDNAYAPPSSGLGTGSGRLVLAGPTGTQYTDDGKTWINGNNSLAMYSICYSSFWGKFVALPRGAASRQFIYSSVDGSSWITTNAGFETTLDLKTVVWSDQLQVFQAAGANSRFWISKDGITWKRQIYNFISGVITINGSKFYPEIGNYIAGTDLANAIITPPIFIA